MVATKQVKALTEAELLKMPESDYMNQAQLEFFRERLLTMERDIRTNADETTEHLRETVIVPDPARAAAETVRRLSRTSPLGALWAPTPLPCFACKRGAGSGQAKPVPRRLLGVVRWLLSRVDAGLGSATSNAGDEGWAAGRG